MGQCDKREKARVYRRECRFVNGVAGGSLLVAFSGISSCDGREKGRDELDRSMAILSERDYHENSGKVDVKAKVENTMNELNKLIQYYIIISWNF